MKTLSVGYLTHLGQAVQQRALCVKITRQDGQILGFTSFDDNLTFDGLEYEAAFAVEVSDLRSAAGTGTDNAEVLGALVSSRITDTDVQAGKYDGSTFRFFEVIWSDTSLGELVYAVGTLGEFTLELPGRYRTEFRSLSQHLQQQIVELYSASCSVKALGDARCKVDLSLFQSTHTVSVWSAAAPTVITFAANTEATSYYRAGRVEFTSGANAGLQQEIKESTFLSGTSEAQIVLQQAFPFAIAIGTDQAILEAGCDRRASTCENVFSNILNFRGFNFLPGTESVMVRGRR